MKNKLQFLIFFILLIYLGVATNGQEIEELSNLKLLKEAEDALSESDYYTAIKYYEEYLNRKPTSSKVGFELALVYSKIRDYENAMRWYKLLYEQDVNRNILALLSFGRMAMASGDVNLAKRSFERFKREFDPGNDKKHIKKLNDFHLDGITLYENEFDSFKVNYIPSYDLDGILNHPFNNGNRVVFLKENNKTGGNFENNPEELIKYLNLYEENIPKSFFSPDRKQFFFSKYDKDSKGNNLASLYQCKKVDGVWGDCSKLSTIVNSDGYNSILPTVAKNSKNGEMVIYFVSDRPEGNGGWDIWYAEFNSRKGTFREPKNLGSKVNTAGNESSPYFDMEEGVLYFSSDGWPGLGSYDIFWIKGEGRSWQDVFNLGTEINTNYDEYYFNHFKDAYYWASNRNESKNKFSPHFYDEFFMTRFLTRIREESLTAKQEEKKVVKEEIVKKEVENDTIYAEKEIEETLREEESNFDIEQFSDSIIKITLYHNFDEAELGNEFLSIIDEYVINKAKSPGLKSVKITSYTDNFGTVAYNKVLSTNRAKFTYGYLTSKGIPQSIIFYEGKGETEPIAPNENPDGTDNPEGRKLNRRTIIEATVK